MSYYLCEMNVNGRGVLKVTPDIALVTIGVITEDKSLKVAQEKNSAIASNVIRELNKQGVPPKDIKTIGYSIDEQYDNVEGKQVFRSYRVRNAFRVTIRDIKRVGEIIDAAVEAGANSVDGVSFQVSQPDKYYNLALQKALNQAVDKAEAIANSTRILVNKTPISITEESTNYQPVYGTMLMKATDGTPISPGEIEISANIKAVFQYKQY